MGNTQLAKNSQSTIYQRNFNKNTPSDRELNKTSKKLSYHGQKAMSSVFKQGEASQLFAN